MAPPTNQTAATAVELGPPNSIFTQRVDDAGTAFTVWYKYTNLNAPMPGNNVIGVWAFGDLTTYKPTINVFSPDGVTLYPAASGGIGLAVNQPIQIPLTATIPQVYYFQVVPNSGNPSPANLTMRCNFAPGGTPQTGELLVMDDTAPFPGAILSNTDGSVQGFLQPFYAGEGAIMLLNPTSAGRYLVQDAAGAQLQILDRTLTSIVTVPFTYAGTAPIVSRNQGSTFYVGTKGAGATKASIRTLSAAGVFGPTTWTLPAVGLDAMAPNASETLLYNAGQTASAGSPIKVWDLVASVMLADLVAGVTNYEISDLLVLGDGTLLALYFNLVNSDSYVKRYNAAGTLLNTYSFGTMTLGGRICHALDDPNSFWAFIHPSPTGTSRFANIRVSDGTLLTNITGVATFELGAFAPVATATPARFGHSQSCPLLIVTPSNAISQSVTNGSGTYTAWTGTCTGP